MKRKSKAGPLSDRICQGCQHPENTEDGPVMLHTETEIGGTAGLYHGRCFARTLRAESRVMTDEDEALITNTLRGAALVELLQEAPKERQSLAAYRRVLKALRVLGLDPETHGQRALKQLDYHDPDGKPYAWLAKKLQEKKK